MKRLILTSTSGSGLNRSGLAEVVIESSFRFAWGPLPSPEKFAAYFGPRSDVQGGGEHWSDWVGRWPRAAKDRKNLAFAKFCKPYDTIELWFDPTPVDQLHLIWLLDSLSHYPELIAKLKLRFVDYDFLGGSLDGLPESEADVPTGDVTSYELHTARKAWQAWRAPTPEVCLNLLGSDLSALPFLRPVLLALVAELPSPVTGLGATELRLLELIGSGYARALGVTHMIWHARSVFSPHEIGYLLDGLAHGPKPAVAGLDDELRTLSKDNHAGRHAAFVRSDDLTLTDFGEAVLAHEDDFSRHNPIHRWWGGTELTSDRLWRLGPVLTQSRRGSDAASDSD